MSWKIDFVVVLRILFNLSIQHGHQASSVLDVFL